MTRLKLLSIGGVTCLLLLGVYIVSSLQSVPPPAAKTTVTQTKSSTIACRSKDVSFCATEVRFRGYVDVADVSDILEQEPDQAVHCSGVVALQPYCKNVSPDLVLQVFAISQQGQIRLLSRNEYISTTAAYLNKYEPLHFVGDAANGTVMTMQFADSAGMTRLSLQFEKANSAWIFRYPLLTN